MPSDKKDKLAEPAPGIFRQFVHFPSLTLRIHETLHICLKSFFNDDLHRRLGFGFHLKFTRRQLLLF